MGYQLIFWQQDNNALSASDSYQALMNGALAQGLQLLPLEPILRAVAEEFPGMEPEPSVDERCPVFWESDGATVIEFSWSDLHVSAELRPAGYWSHDVANRVIDLLARFDCPLYDAQTNERFDS